MARHVYTSGHLEVFEVVGKSGTYHVAIDLGTMTIECNCLAGWFRLSPWGVRDTRICKHCRETLIHLANMGTTITTPGVIDLYHGDLVDGSNGFHKMKDAGIVGIVHKSSEGLSMVDGAYSNRRARAKAVGIKWGAYHFLRNLDGADQAKFFLDHAQPDKDTLLAIDWEEPPMGRPPATLAQANAFAEVLIREAGGGLLYSGRSFLIDHKVKGDMPVAKLHLWVARYNATLGSVPGGWTDWLFWQNSDAGRVAGIYDTVDLDLFNGTLEQLVSGWPFRSTV